MSITLDVSDASQILFGEVVTRRYDLFIPSVYNVNNPAKLVVDFHGASWKRECTVHCSSNGQVQIGVVNI